MLGVLHVNEPLLQIPAPNDAQVCGAPSTNRHGQWLDYVLSIQGYAQAADSRLRVVTPMTSVPAGYPYYHTGGVGDLSDHLAMWAQFRFPSSERVQSVPTVGPALNPTIETEDSGGSGGGSGGSTSTPACGNGTCDTGETCGTCGVDCDCDFAVGKFQPWAGYAIDNGRGWRVADLDGDGKEDLVHLTSADYWRTWTSNGDGTFRMGMFRPWAGYSVSTGPDWLVGDFNGDGKDDLVHLVGDHVNTWTSNGNGTFRFGTFKPWAGYNVADGRGWRVTDLNGDGRSDLVHLTSADYVYTWLSNGDGTYQVGTFKPAAGYSVAAGRDWLVADLNADGKGDLVHLVGEYVRSWISNGDGTFAIGYFGPWVGYATGDGRGFRVIDLNGDGKSDLVHLTSGDRVTTWTSNGDGSFQMGTFNPWAGYSISSGPDWLATSLDVDADGDLVHLVGESARPWTSNGNGTFHVGMFKPWPGYTTGDGRGWLVADLNGDGKSDLVHLTSADYVYTWMKR
jgi:hypothetical protein